VGEQYIIPKCRLSRIMIGPSLRAEAAPARYSGSGLPSAGRCGTHPRAHRAPCPDTLGPDARCPRGASGPDEMTTTNRVRCSSDKTRCLGLKAALGWVAYLARTQFVENINSATLAGSRLP
jgi:hypothetical protein